MEEERYCGNCCWFYAEDTYGYGMCPFKFGKIVVCDDPCTSEKDFVSRQEMRHHMAVILQANRWTFENNGCLRRMPKPSDIDKAQKFAYRYMKTFGEL